MARIDNIEIKNIKGKKANAKSHTHFQFAPASAPPKIAKEYVFADAKQNIMKEVRVLTTAMRQAGNRSSVDRLRIREMSVFKRTFPGKSPARRIAAKRWWSFKKNIFGKKEKFDFNQMDK